MSTERVAHEHYRDRKSLSDSLGRLVQQVWTSVDPANLDASWAQAAPALAVALAGAQLATARRSDGYVSAVLREQGADPDGESIAAQAFIGASDGRDLDGLLRNPITVVKTAISAGLDVRQAMASGYANLDMLMRTQLADAGRAADQVALTTRPAATGYVRMLSGKSCSRCIVLAGRRYRWNAGFNRHPRCDCIGVPTAEAAPPDLQVDPRKAFDALSPAEQDKVFTKAGAQAIRDGSNIGRTVNARRGMYTAGGKVLTTEATTRRGINRRVRMMPEQIYREAGGDRDEALRLLRAHGYITGAPVRAPLRTPPATPVRVVRPAKPVEPKPAPTPSPAVRVAPPAPAAPPRPPSLAERVKGGVTSRETLSGGQNAVTELLTLNDGSKVVFKKAKRIGHQSARSQQDAEELAPLVLRAVGLRAPEIYRPSANQLYMEFMDGELATNFLRRPTYRVRPETYDADQGLLLGLADQLMDNYDRNPGNWLIAADRTVRPIDHGFAFAYYSDKGEMTGVLDVTFGPDNPSSAFHGTDYPYTSQWADNDMNPADLGILRGRLQALRPEFERVGRLEWHDAVMTRLGIVEQHAKGTKRRIR